jgi:hypothetical protein
LAYIVTATITVIRLWAGDPNNHAITPSKNIRFVSSPQCLDCLFEPPSLILNGYWRLFLGSVVVGALSHNSPTLRMSGAISPLHYMPL